MSVSIGRLVDIIPENSEYFRNEIPGIDILDMG